MTASASGHPLEPRFEDVRVEERIRRVRALLETRFDYLPGERSSMPETSSGPAEESKYVPCEACRGRGRVTYRRTGRKLDRICLACDGTGQRRRRKDDPAYDSYVGRVRPGRPRVMTANEYDDQISRLRELEDLRAGRPQPNERYGWERARVSRDAAGSYRELDRAVHELHRRIPGCSVYSLGGLIFLQAHMSSTIRLPGRLHEELTPQRINVARDLHACGWTAGEIGRALGVSRTRVGRWLKPSG